MARGVTSTAGPTCLLDDTRRANRRQRADSQLFGAVSVLRSQGQIVSLYICVAVRRRFLHRRTRSFPSEVAGQYAEETAQAVLGVGSGVEVDAHHPQFRVDSAGILTPVLSLFVSHISREGRLPGPPASRYGSSLTGPPARPQCSRRYGCESLIQVKVANGGGVPWSGAGELGSR